jgi:hypothetical protein
VCSSDLAWRGEDLAGRSLLLSREQGLGDMIMFARAIPRLRDAGQVHLAVHPPLARLFARSFPGARVWASDCRILPAGQQTPQPWRAAAGPIDLHARIGSLGRLALGSDVGMGGPYLSADPDAVEAWRRRLDAMAPRSPGVRRIGLCNAARVVPWDADARANGVLKTVPPAALRALAEAAGVQWVSLQAGDLAPQLAEAPGLDVVDCSRWLTDLDDTAALIQALDAVVSVDTAVAHLAGALGKPLHLLLRRNADWRWALGDRSAWYPSARLYRQTDLEDWAPVLAGVVKALEETPA